MREPSAVAHVTSLVLDSRAPSREWTVIFCLDCEMLRDEYRRCEFSE
jgi:hypothetical protein